MIAHRAPHIVILAPGYSGNNSGSVRGSKFVVWDSEAMSPCRELCGGGIRGLKVAESGGDVGELLKAEPTYDGSRREEMKNLDWSESYNKETGVMKKN
jgi:hypothetical protein